MISILHIIRTFITDNTNQSHEVHTLGQFKDDQLGLENAVWRDRYNGSSSSYGFYYDGSASWNVSTLQILKNARIGYTTHGKQIGVTYLIKVL